MTDTQLAKQDEKPNQIQTVSVDTSSYACFLDTAKFNQIWRVATMFAGSQTVPAHYRGKPNDCFIAFVIAERLRTDPYMFMQKTFVIAGKIGYEAQEIIALANTRGVFTGPIRFKFEGVGEKRQCTAYATMKSDGQQVESTVSWDMVKAEGWDKNPKWKSMTDHMFKYRSASFLISEVCPEVKLGMYTKEELEDIGLNEKPQKQLPVSSLEQKLTKKVDSVVSDPKPSENEDGIPSGEPEQAQTAQTGEISTQDSPKTTNDYPNGVPAQERYFCPECDSTFPKPAGLNKDLCLKLHKGIVDRWSNNQ